VRQQMFLPVAKALQQLGNGVQRRVGQPQLHLRSQGRSRGSARRATHRLGTDALHISCSPTQMTSLGPPPPHPRTHTHAHTHTSPRPPGPEAAGDRPAAGASPNSRKVSRCSCCCRGGRRGGRQPGTGAAAAARTLGASLSAASSAST
jgi:hypothetical protein